MQYHQTMLHDYLYISTGFHLGGMRRSVFKTLVFQHVYTCFVAVMQGAKSENISSFPNSHYICKSVLLSFQNSSDLIHISAAKNPAYTEVLYN